MRTFTTIDEANAYIHTTTGAGYPTTAAFMHDDGGEAIAVALRCNGGADERLCDFAHAIYVAGDPRRKASEAPGAWVAFKPATYECDVDALAAQVAAMTEAQCAALIEAARIEFDVYAVIGDDASEAAFDAGWRAMRESYGSREGDALDAFIEACAEAYLGD